MTCTTSKVFSFKNFLLYIATKLFREKKYEAQIGKLIYMVLKKDANVEVVDVYLQLHVQQGLAGHESCLKYIISSLPINKPVIKK